MTHNPLSTAHFPTHLINNQNGRVNDVDLQIWLRNLRHGEQPGPNLRFYKAAYWAIEYGANLSDIQDRPYEDRVSHLV